MYLDNSHHQESVLGSPGADRVTFALRLGASSCCASTILALAQHTDAGSAFNRNWQLFPF